MMYVLHKNDILLYTGIHGNHNPLLGKLTFQNDTSSAGLNWYFSYVLTSSYLHTDCS